MLLGLCALLLLLIALCSWPFALRADILRILFVAPYYKSILAARPNGSKGLTMETMENETRSDDELS